MSTDFRKDQSNTIRINKLFAKFIYDKRRSKKVVIDSMNWDTGISDSKIWEIETGESNASLSDAVAICKNLNCNLHEFESYLIASNQDTENIVVKAPINETLNKMMTSMKASNFNYRKFVGYSFGSGEVTFATLKKASLNNLFEEHANIYGLSISEGLDIREWFQSPGVASEEQLKEWGIV